MVFLWAKINKIQSIHFAYFSLRCSSTSCSLVNPVFIISSPSSSSAAKLSMSLFGSCSFIIQLLLFRLQIYIIFVRKE